MKHDRIVQIQFPDPYPRLLLDERGIYAGESFTVLRPDDWHTITLEACWEPTGFGC